MTRPSLRGASECRYAQTRLALAKVIATDMTGTTETTPTIGARNAGSTRPMPNPDSPPTIDIVNATPAMRAKSQALTSASANSTRLFGRLLHEADVPRIPRRKAPDRIDAGRRRAPAARLHHPLHLLLRADEQRLDPAVAAGAGPPPPTPARGPHPPPPPGTP